MRIQKGTLVWTNKFGEYNISYPDEPTYLSETIEVNEYRYHDYLTHDKKAFKITSKHSLITDESIIWMKYDR